MSRATARSILNSEAAGLPRASPGSAGSAPLPKEYIDQQVVSPIIAWSNNGGKGCICAKVGTGC
jgi:hypothetical protein